MKTRLGKALRIWVLLAAGCSLVACSFPFPRAKSWPRATTVKAQPAARPAPVRQTAPDVTVRAATVSAPTTPVTKVAIAPPERASDKAAPKARQHSVAKKETVYGISRLYRVPVRSLIDRNKLVPPYGLRIGQKLTIPELREHTVAKGDTVYSISQRYEVDQTELVRLNGIAPPHTIKLRQKLVLPDARQKASPARPAGTKLAVAAPASPAPKAIPKPPPRAGSKFLWPVQGKVILGFGPKSNGLHNDGINIKAPRGAPVKAAENGVVAYAGNELRGFGNLLLIKHAGGWVTAYAHTDKVLVRRGDKVRRGQTIGRVGSTGNVASPQLHFEVRKGTRAVNPAQMLGPQTARLSN